MNSFLEMLESRIIYEISTRDVFEGWQKPLEFKRGIWSQVQYKRKGVHVRFMEIDELGYKECVRRKM